MDAFVYSWPTMAQHDLSTTHRDQVGEKPRPEEAVLHIETPPCPPEEVALSDP